MNGKIAARFVMSLGRPKGNRLFMKASLLIVRFDRRNSNEPTVQAQAKPKSVEV
jgi:hypothetical protein